MRRLAVFTAVVTGALTVLLSTVPAQATAPGENGRIAFRRFTNAQHTRGDIFTVRADGSDERQVTHSAQTMLATEPDWSPTGRWIVYMLSRHGDLDDSRLFKIRPNGTHRTALAPCEAPCLADGFAQWSPTGEQIAFRRGLGPAPGQPFVFAIYVMSADGTHLRRVTHRGASIATDHRFFDFNPTWSPTGTRLAFERYNTHTERHAVFTVRLDGTGLRKITRWALDGAQPDWSPNGRWIVFRSKENSDDSGNVWVVHPDGTGLHQVTHIPAGKGKWASGSFSPDGRLLTYGRFPGHGKAGNADIYVLPVDGTQMHNITNSFPWESSPDWGPRQS